MSNPSPIPTAAPPGSPAVEELTALARRIQANRNDLESWQRLGELVDDPRKKRDCLNQVTRIRNQRFGQLTPLPCRQCSAFLQVTALNEDGSWSTCCPVCQAVSIEPGNRQPDSRSAPRSVDPGPGAAWWSDRITLAAILASNLLPVFGILFLGWSMGSVMGLYWFENVIVGLFTLLKMAFAEGQAVSVSASSRGRVLPGRPFVLAFFCVHFGMFCFGHGVFVLALFFPKGLVTRQGPNVLAGLALPILVMLISHGIHFVRNYLGNGAYRSASINRLMGEPYARIAPMHVALIAAGFFIATLGSPMPAVLALVLLKTGAEVAVYRNSTRKWLARMPQER